MVFRCDSDKSPTQSIRVENAIIYEVCSEMHLGHRLVSSDTDASIVKHAVGSFWGSYNSMISDFGRIRPDILCKIFKSYCCSFYGAPFWNLSLHAETV